MSLLRVALVAGCLSVLTSIALGYYVGPMIPNTIPQDKDWLVHPENVQQRTELLQLDAARIQLTNGLISRTFLLAPNFVTVAYQHELTGFNYWRAPKPEAQFSLMDGTVVLVGGVTGSDNNQALWSPEYYKLSSPANAFVYVNHSIEPAHARFHWKPQRWSELRAWPPAGLRLNVDFAAPSGMQQAQGLAVRVVYEMYDGIPVLTKFIQINNTLSPTTPLATQPTQTQTQPQSTPVEISEVIHSAPTSDIFGAAVTNDKLQHRHQRHLHDTADDEHDHTHSLAHDPLLDAWQSVLARNRHTHSHAAYDEADLYHDPRFSLPDGSAYVNRGFVYNGQFITAVTVEFLACPEHACDKVMDAETDAMPRHTQWDTRWTPYPLNTSLWGQDWAYGFNAYDSELQGDWAYYVTMLSANYTMGPDVVIPPGSSWESFHVLELAHDSMDEERQNLARRRWMRTLAPQGTENPIYWHATDQNNLLNAINETAQAGFEMVILSYGSGFNPESTDPIYIAQISNATEYAHSLGVMLGGYTLMQNPHNGLNFATEVIDPNTGQGAGIACFATEAHRRYRESLRSFVNVTGIDMLETDGPYEGAPCASHTHEYHRGLGDSQAAQDYYTQDFYRSVKVNDLYLTVPDPYWLNGGTNKEPIGYTDRWSGSSFDKHERLAIGRMYSYDGTTHYPPTMGWMVFNYGDYSPLSENLEFIELALAQYLGNGIVTCFRGPDLYDSDTTLALFRHWSAFYKKHRTVLNGDIVHVMRPNGQDIDVQLHVHPPRWPFAKDFTSEIALGWLFNPSPADKHAVTQRINLYYAAAQPGDVVQLQWGSSQVKPWNLTATVNAVVDESFSIDIEMEAMPAYQWAYFIVTQQQRQ